MKKNGLTLIEVVTTAAIIGIIAAVVIPRFSSDTVVKYQVKNYARRLVSDFRLARMMAVSRRTNFILNISGHSYAIYQTSVNPGNQQGETRTWPAGFTVGGDTTFTFSQTGEVSGGTQVSLANGGHTWTVTLTPATGLALLTGS